MKKIYIFILSLFVSGGAYAAVDSALVARAEKYLNGITGLSGDFVQTSGARTDMGKFSMLRTCSVRL